MVTLLRFLHAPAWFVLVAMSTCYFKFFNEMGPRGNQEQRVGYRCDGGQSRTPVVVLCEIQAIGTTWGP